MHSLITAMNSVVAAPAGACVVRYTAENSLEGLEVCATWWQASLKWMIVLLGIVMPLCIILSKNIAVWTLGNEDYAWLVIISAVALPLSAANLFIGFVVNGFQKYKLFAYLGIKGVTVSTVATVALIVTLNLNGVLLTGGLLLSFSGIVMIIGSIGQPWFKGKYLFGVVQAEKLKNIGSYVAMAVTSAVTVPVSLIIVRNIIVDNSGWEQVGNWQAVYKISEVYLGVITLTLSIYYLLKLAAIKDSTLIIKEINNTLKLILQIVVIIALLIYSNRYIIINLIFSEKFSLASDLFAFQLIGDVLKVVTWIYAFPMLSQGTARWYISIEIFFSILFIGFTVLFIEKYSTKSATFSYALSYLIISILLICFKKKYIK